MALHAYELYYEANNMKKEEKKLLIRKGLVKIRLARKMAHKTVN